MCKGSTKCRACNLSGILTKKTMRKKSNKFGGVVDTLLGGGVGAGANIALNYGVDLIPAPISKSLKQGIIIAAPIAVAMVAPKLGRKPIFQNASMVSSGIAIKELIEDNVPMLNTSVAGLDLRSTGMGVSYPMNLAKKDVA